jgi:hypothetical protein
MFGSSSPPVFCRREHVLFVFDGYSGVQHIMCCFCFVFIRLVYPMLPVSLDCPFLIVPSVFSDVYSKYCNLFYMKHVIL